MKITAPASWGPILEMALLIADASPELCFGTEVMTAVVSGATIIIKAAAVADYHLANPPTHKVKKTAARLSLELEPTSDILAEIGKKKGDRLLVGFAAETENLVAEARRKLESKNCDMVVGNLVSGLDTGFDSGQNEVVLVTRNGEAIPVGRAPKREIARRILDQIIHLRLALHASR